jgi:hypothetical protein
MYFPILSSWLPHLVLAGPPQQLRSPSPLGQVSAQGLISMDAIVLVTLNVFKRWLEAVRWQPARGFATVQDSTTPQYQIIADGNIAATNTSHSSTILTTLSAYDSSFQDLWSNRVMVHNDMLWTLPPPKDHFCPLPTPSRPARNPASSQLPPFPYPDWNPPNSSGDGPCKRLRESFITYQGMLKLAVPIPPGQRLMAYIFNAMPERTQYPKMLDNDRKADCLICFCKCFSATRQFLSAQHMHHRPTPQMG